MVVHGRNFWLIAKTQNRIYPREGCRSILALKICHHFYLSLASYKCLKMEIAARYDGSDVLY